MESEKSTFSEEPRTMEEMKEKLRQVRAENKRLRKEEERRKSKDRSEGEAMARGGDWWRWTFNCKEEVEDSREYWTRWGRVITVSEAEQWRAQRMRWFLDGVEEAALRRLLSDSD